MASVTFPIVKRTVRAPKPPPAQDPWRFYAQISCEGPNGEVLLLTYLRPDRPWLGEYISLNQVLANSYDPVSRRGVAYFPAWQYTWHKAMFGRKNAYAQVDDEYPGGNRIFTYVPESPTSQGPVPDVVAWLKQRPNVYNALTWLDSTDKEKLYSDWTAQQQQDFQAAFAAAWNHQPWPLDDPPPNLVVFDEFYSTGFDGVHAWRLFCALAAYSLAVEIGGRVPWSITGYPDSDLRLLLGSDNILWWMDNLKAYQLDIYAVPAPPELAWAFLNSWELIGKDRITTIARMLDWCRNNLIHVWYTKDGETLAEQMVSFWGYLGKVPVSRIIRGTVCDGAPELGIRHFTAGCECTSAFLQSVLRVINIPVEICNIGWDDDWHQTPHFTTEDLYLSHSDDLCSQLVRCTPPFDVNLILLDSKKFNSWFGSSVPPQIADTNVGRQAAELGVQYLPDDLLHLYNWDQQLAGHWPPQNGLVYQMLQYYYPDFNTLYPDLWLRMDQKLLKFGARSGLELWWPGPAIPPPSGTTPYPVPQGPPQPPVRRMTGPIPPPGPLRRFKPPARSKKSRLR